MLHRMNSITQVEDTAQGWAWYYGTYADGVLAGWQVVEAPADPREQDSFISECPFCLDTGWREVSDPDTGYSFMRCECNPAPEVEPFWWERPVVVNTAAALAWLVGIVSVVVGAGMLRALGV